MTNLTVNYLNLHSYKMGALELPATEQEINEFWENLNPNGSHDVELQWVESELSNDLDNLSFGELVELSEMDESDAIDLVNIYNAVDSWDEAKEVHENGDFMMYDQCNDMSDVAYAFYEETGQLAELEKVINASYIDWNAIGRDMEIEGHFHYLGNSVYIQIMQ